MRWLLLLKTAVSYFAFGKSLNHAGNGPTFSPTANGAPDAWSKTVIFQEKVGIGPGEQSQFTVPTTAATMTLLAPVKLARGADPAFVSAR
jgi:hypothetical protein